MPVIKTVLREEYQNAVEMEKEYDHVLNSLPKGDFCQKGHSGRGILLYYGTKRGQDSL